MKEKNVFEVRHRQLCGSVSFQLYASKSVLKKWIYTRASLPVKKKEKSKIYQDLSENTKPKPQPQTICHNANVS